jgi:hypothetical protein
MRSQLTLTKASSASAIREGGVKASLRTGICACCLPAGCSAHLASQGPDVGRRRVTAGSQSPGTGTVSRVTKGHQPGRFRIREDDKGVCRAPEDTSAPRFGTVRPRVQKRWNALYPEE